jgi:hypothetical protein
LIQYPKFVFEKKAPVPFFAGSPSDDLAVYSHRFFIPAALGAELTPGYSPSAPPARKNKEYAALDEAPALAIVLI